MNRIAILLLFACGLHADVQAVKAEENLEKRSELALEYAEKEISAAKKAYDSGDFPGFRKHLDEVVQLGELSLESLDETGKRARKSPKYFKRAEKKLREILRRMNSFEKDVSYQDRDTVAAVRKRLSALHDRVLLDIMTKK